jgi:hypothetical protein
MTAGARNDRPTARATGSRSMLAVLSAVVMIAALVAALEGIK